MRYILWLWVIALYANPYGWVFGTIAGIIIGVFLPQYLLARILNAVWLAAATIVAAALGGYLMALTGGFLSYGVTRILLRFS